MSIRKQVTTGTAIVLAISLVATIVSEPENTDQQAVVMAPQTRVYLPLMDSAHPSNKTPRLEQSRKVAQLESHSSLTWRQSVYRGNLIMSEVKKVINDGRGESLEFCLSEDSREAIQSETTGPIDDLLLDLGVIYNEEVADAKHSLRDRPDRYQLINDRSSPEEQVALWSLRDKIEGKTGAVWGDIDPLTGKEIHYVVLWSEWPSIRKNLQDQVALINERKRSAREWIEKSYATNGMAIFSDHSILTAKETR